ncbi:hypothetical protein [Laspinema olomoucense]|uniref:Type II secretion system protein GspC N-terminal domain-containing protein n=1 Tax=Laspinema olomoucense D3b TaxID=2953688 RepID=A0ABT2NDT3_9CYAN|nr:MULTISPECIES: hypothetical protein [unclassified Laspinema]MCT7975337.1 hypothetical protein [Laspinema sp. D3d]MCT7980858.1 hypothetical protein [Laspinema sp. D3b]MCT7988779.1 hypothetical protein [Laspinema sp. D3a]MCT7995881.1 hypothetical protein [Laspinema sp. D3c]
MSQDISTKTIDSPQAEQERGGVGTPNWSVDAYADRLMNDLFQDVDRILDGGTRKPKPAPPDLVTLQSVQVPQIILPPTMMPKTAAEATVDAKATRTDKRRKGQSFDRLLLGSACGLLLITLGLWLWNRGYLQQFWAKIAPAQPEAVAPPKTAEQLKAEADADFAAYMERSLDVMDRQAAGQPTEPVVPPNTALPIPPPPPPVNVTVNPPNVMVPAPQVTVNTPHQGNLAEVLNRIAIALERGINPTLVQPNLTVTIPRTPPAPQTTAAAPKPAAPAPAASPKPAAPAPAASPKPAAPAPTATQTPTPEPAPTPTPTQPPRTVNIPPQVAAPPPPVPQPAPPTAEEAPGNNERAENPAAEESEPVPAAAASSSSVSGLKHKLVGILELGDRSVALFEVDGVPRRVNIGETIGSSGWSLVEVKDGEAIIRRNGEVRSIYTGQSL